MTLDKKSIRKVVVTGATGFLGSRMISFLKDRDFIVKGIGKIKNGNQYRKRWFSKADEIESIDLRDPKLVFESLKGYDMVFHFAADMGGVGYFSEANYTPFINNMRMDLNIVEGAEKAGIKRVYYASSACAYPVNTQKKEGSPPKLSEKMLIPADADQMYGWEKFVMILLSEYAPVDIRVGIMNTIFGEGQEGVGPRAKFPPSIVWKIIQSKKTGKPVEIWGNGNQTRTFLYVEDALEKIYEVMTSDKKIGAVNIAADETVTVKQCADWLCDYAKITPKFIYLLNKPSGVISRGIDNSKFYKYYSYRNKVTTKEGFKNLYKFMKKYGAE